MSTVAFPLASHLWCAVDPVGWNVSTETPETSCVQPVSFFGDDEAIVVSVDGEGRVSFAKEGEYEGGKYVGRVLTDEQYFDEEEEELVEEVVAEVLPVPDFFEVPVIATGTPVTTGPSTPTVTTTPTTPTTPWVPDVPIFPVVFPDPPSDEEPDVHGTTLTPIEPWVPPSLPDPAPVPLPPALAIVAISLSTFALIKTILRMRSGDAAA